MYKMLYRPARWETRTETAMARTKSMNWVPSRKAWRKQHLGQTVVVSCRQLRKQFPDLLSGETETGSYRAANAWWKQRMADLYGQQAIRLAELRTLAGKLDGNLQTLVDLLIGQWDDLQRSGADFPVRMSDEGIIEPGPSDEEPAVVQAKDKLRRFVADELATNYSVVGTAAATERPASAISTIGAGLDGFNGWKRTQADSGTISEGRCRELDTAIKLFKKWLGARVHLHVDRLDYGLCAEYHNHLQSRRAKKEIGSYRARDLWNACRDSVRWLQDNGRVERFDLSRLRVQVHTKDVETFTVDEIKTLLANCDERMKLFQLLMLNTAGTQKDLSDLLKSEVNFRQRRLTRKRSKKSLSNEDSLPVVSYRLWKETTELLKRFQSDDPSLLLLSPEGGRLVKGRIDYIGMTWRRHRDALLKAGTLERNLPLKVFRKTVATMLADKYDEALAAHFCGHSAKTTFQKSYWKKNQEKLDKATAWLGQQFGIE